LNLFSRLFKFYLGYARVDCAYDTHIVSIVYLDSTSLTNIKRQCDCGNIRVYKLISQAPRSHLENATWNFNKVARKANT